MNRCVAHGVQAEHSQDEFRTLHHGCRQMTFHPGRTPGRSVTVQLPQFRCRSRTNCATKESKDPDIFT